MISKLKKILYFPLAYYFRVFAKIQLLIWKPTRIVVTGSSGKTTLLHLIESQIQGKAKYSHYANSSFGIPFDILGLRRKNLTVEEWPYLFFAAPFNAFKKPYKEKLYVVEADCDRPYEGKFLARLLKPNITLWTNVSRTHTVNFDNLVKNQNFKTVEEAIAHEFGYFLEETKSLAIVNGDSEQIKKQIPRSKASIKTVAQIPYSSSDQASPESREVFKGKSSRQDGYQMVTRQARTINPEITFNYKVFKDHTEFRINGKDYLIKALLPKETSYSIQMTLALLEFLNIKPYLSFSKFSLPPGRCSLLKGIKKTIIIDSSYNATPDGVKSILGMFDLYPNDKKWLVLGDMIELGDEEQEEHEKLADIVASIKLEKIILVGPRLLKYTYPKLKILFNRHPELVSGSRSSGFEIPKQDGYHTVTRQVRNDKIEKFTMPKEALDYLINNLKSGEVLLFKGARFLEGIIEHLLLDKNDIKKLCRREKIWQERRKKWGL